MLECAAYARTGLRLARLQRNPVPAELMAQADKAPVVRAFVHEQRLSLAHRVDIDSVFLEIVRKRLLDGEQCFIDGRVIRLEIVEDGGNGGGIGDLAAKVCGQPLYSGSKSDTGDFAQSSKIPRAIVPA